MGRGVQPSARGSGRRNPTPVIPRPNGRLQNISLHWPCSCSCLSRLNRVHPSLACQHARTTPHIARSKAFTFHFDVISGSFTSPQEIRCDAIMQPLRGGMHGGLPRILQKWHGRQLFGPPENANLCCLHLDMITCPLDALSKEQVSLIH